MTGDTDVLQVDEADGVATVTLDRPASRNALNDALRRALWSTMERLDADDGVDVVILTGADPAFCAGLDLREVNDPDFFAQLTSPDSSTERIGRRPVPEMRKLLIGAVNGAAVTGGLELALACDLRIASERATFRDTHATVGVVPGWGLDRDLPEAVGVARARQMSATCAPVDAATALTWGLVNEVVPHDRLLPRAIEIASMAAAHRSPIQRRILDGYHPGRRDG